jgi:uncharacterized protein YjeT (DUF2065 family)
MEVTKLATRMKIGITLMTAAGILIVLSAVIALANIEKTTSWTLATLRIVGLFLLAAGTIIVYLAKQDKEAKKAVERAGGTVGLSRHGFGIEFLSNQPTNQYTP